jgi:hypothetical protein
VTTIIAVAKASVIGEMSHPRMYDILPMIRRRARRRMALIDEQHRRERVME